MQLFLYYFIIRGGRRKEEVPDFWRPSEDGRWNGRRRRPGRRTRDFDRLAPSLQIIGDLSREDTKPTESGGEFKVISRSRDRSVRKRCPTAAETEAHLACRGDGHRRNSAISRGSRRAGRSMKCWKRSSFFSHFTGTSFYWLYRVSQGENVISSCRVTSRPVKISISADIPPKSDGRNRPLQGRHRPRTARAPRHPEKLRPTASLPDRAVPAVPFAPFRHSEAEQEI